MDSIAAATWDPDDYLHFKTSIYLNFALAKAEDPSLTGMGELLEKWATLEFKDEKNE